MRMIGKSKSFSTPEYTIQFDGHDLEEKNDKRRKRTDR